MLYVIRQGKTDWNNRKKTMGRMDLPLCPEGIAQAHKMKDKLKYNNFDLIMCSPLTRAKETAKIINEGKDIEIVYDQRLLERNLANLEGRSYPEDNDRLWDINVNANDFYNASYIVSNAQSIVEFITLIMIFMTKDNRGLHDVICNTKVVKC